MEETLNNSVKFRQKEETALQALQILGWFIMTRLWVKVKTSWVALRQTNTYSRKEREQDSISVQHRNRCISISSWIECTELSMSLINSVAACVPLPQLSLSAQLYDRILLCLKILWWSIGRSLTVKWQHPEVLLILLISLLISTWKCQAWRRFRHERLSLTVG